MTDSMGSVNRKKRKPSAEDPRLEALKRQIAQLGYARPGVLVRRFMRCGRPGCACMADPPRLHGPYHQWSYRTKGKTRSLRLTEDQARLCKSFIENHRQLRRIVRNIEQHSLKKTDESFGAISDR